MNTQLTVLGALSPLVILSVVWEGGGGGGGGVISMQGHNNAAHRYT